MRSGVSLILTMGLMFSLVGGFYAGSFNNPACAKSSSQKGKGEGRKENWKTALQGAPDIEACRKRVEENPKSADARNDLGWALRQNDKLKEAEVELRKALELDETIPYGHSNLSVVLLDTGRVDEAIKEGERAVGIEPKSPIFRVVYGNALAAKKEWQKAEEQYSQAVNLKPNYENALYHLGRVLYAQGKSAQAGAVLSQAIDLDPNDHRVMKLLDKIMPPK